MERGNMLMNAVRQTGRTARMLIAAKEFDIAGVPVYIIVANRSEAERIRRLLPKDTGIKVKTPESCGNFNWETMCLRGTHSDCRVLVDHLAIELRFRAILQELHRYD